MKKHRNFGSGIKHFPRDKSVNGIKYSVFACNFKGKYRCARICHGGFYKS